jgi:hypothetical protein
MSKGQNAKKAVKKPKVKKEKKIINSITPAS